MYIKKHILHAYLVRIHTQLMQRFKITHLYYVYFLIFLILFYSLTVHISMYRHTILTNISETKVSKNNIYPYYG